MKKKILAQSQVYRLLEPGPVVLVTTAHQGKMNIMTMSWHTMMDFEPPKIGCVISNRNHTFDILKSTKECVINIPAVNLAKKVVACGNTSGYKINKFEKFSLTAMPASLIKSPLIDECFANLECKVTDVTLVTKYNFFILEVIKSWISSEKKSYKTIHHRGNGIFMVAGKDIKLPSKMK